MNFHATNVEYWTKEGVETVFFGNQEQGLALLLSTVPGTTDHYLEWNDQANACVNGVRQAALSGDELHLQLVQHAVAQLVETDFRVACTLDKELFREVSRRLRLVLRAKLRVKQARTSATTGATKDISKVKASMPLKMPMRLSDCPSRARNRLIIGYILPA